MNNFGSYTPFVHLDQANLICFLGISSKLTKEKYLKHIFCIFSFTRKISSTFIKESSKLIRRILGLYVEYICVPLLLSVFFPGKLPIYMRSK